MTTAHAHKIDLLLLAAFRLEVCLRERLDELEGHSGGDASLILVIEARNSALGAALAAVTTVSKVVEIAEAQLRAQKGEPDGA